MNCPHCQQPIPPALVRKAANQQAGSSKRPASAANTRNPYGRKGKPKESPGDEPGQGMQQKARES